jgi:hypothetical protein
METSPISESCPCPVLAPDHRRDEGVLGPLQDLVIPDARRARPPSRASTACLPASTGATRVRRPGRLHPAPHARAGGPRPQRRGLFRTALARARRGRGLHAGARSRPLPRPRSVPDPARRSSRRSPTSRVRRDAERWVRRTAGLLAANREDPADRRRDFDIIHDNQCMGPGILKPAPPRLAAARDAAPPDHRRPLDRARPRRDGVEALHDAPLVRLPAHAGARGQATAGGPHGLAQLQDRHQRADAGAARSITVVPVGVDHTVFRPYDDVVKKKGRLMVTSSERRAHEGPRPAPRSDRQIARRTRHRPRSSSADPEEGPGRDGAGAPGPRATSSRRSRASATRSWPDSTARPRSRSCPASTRASRCRRSRP